MLHFKQHTAPFLINGVAMLLDRLLQISHLGKGRLQLGVLILGRLLGCFAVAGLLLMGLLRGGHPPLQVLHLGLELALVVGQLAALLVHLG